MEAMYARRLPPPPVRRSLLAIALTLAACGDPILDESYRGVPQGKLEGKVDWAGTGPPSIPNVRMALFFTPGGVEVVDPEMWVELTDSTTAVGVLPSPFVMNIFAWPGAALQVKSQD